MKGDRLPAHEHVARHCRKNDLFWNGIVPERVLESAFEPDDDGVSTTWLEFFKGNHHQNLIEVRKAVCASLTPKSSNRLAILNVGNIEANAAAAKAHVIEDPIADPRGNPAHALVKEPADFKDVKVREAVAATVKPADIETYY